VPGCSATAFIGTLMGAVDALKLITNGPEPPSRGATESGSSKSSIVKCQISPVNGVLIGVPIKAFRGLSRW
jgi:hypothetical protein